jgi:hypothetical protein
MADVRACEVRATLVPLNIEPYYYYYCCYNRSLTSIKISLRKFFSVECKTTVCQSIKNIHLTPSLTVITNELLWLGM